MAPPANRYKMQSLFLVCCLAAAGCGKMSENPRVIPVTGKLQVDGLPAAKAVICFHLPARIESDASVATAIVEADGSFRPSTYLNGDGLPVGEYIVTVAWPRYVEFDGQQIASDDQLQGKYSNPARSTLRASVGATSVELPLIDLSR